jgi:carboxylesterase type B
VAHGDEIAYVFGKPFDISVILPFLDEKERILSALMMNYWANFAKTGRL